MSSGPASFPQRRHVPRPGFWPGCLAVLAILVTGARAEVPLPPYRELRELVRQNVHGLPESELDAAAAEALLAKVRGRLLGPGEVAEAVSADTAVLSRSVMDGCAYVRVGQVTLGLAPQLAAALVAPETASVRGLILDLRGAGGTDYLAAANVVDLFLDGRVPMLSWGGPVAQSTGRTNAWTRPVAVLVNRETRGGAEAVAAALRQQRLGILIGDTTAGVAAVFREVPLPGNSQARLRLAVDVIRTGDGQALPATGVEPDIRVKVRPDQERAYLANPYTEAFSSSTAIAGLATNNAFSLRRRTSEADLVRQKREVEAGVRGSAGVPSTNTAAGTATKAPAEAPKVVRDPVLGRAIDLLKGLTLMDGGKPGAKP